MPCQLHACSMCLKAVGYDSFILFDNRQKMSSTYVEFWNLCVMNSCVNNSGTDLKGPSAKIVSHKVKKFQFCSKKKITYWQRCRLLRRMARSYLSFGSTR